MITPNENLKQSHSSLVENQISIKQGWWLHYGNTEDHGTLIQKVRPITLMFNKEWGWLETPNEEDEER